MIQTGRGVFRIVMPLLLRVFSARNMPYFQLPLGALGRGQQGLGHRYR